MIFRLENPVFCSRKFAQTFEQYSVIDTFILERLFINFLEKKRKYRISSDSFTRAVTLALPYHGGLKIVKNFKKLITFFPK
jgi:hypothetical protein